MQGVAHGAFHLGELLLKHLLAHFIRDTAADKFLLCHIIFLLRAVIGS